MSPLANRLTWYLVVCLLQANEAMAFAPLFPSLPPTTNLRLDVQDVSYLWPSYSDQELLPAIQDAARGWDLLPSRQVFKKLQKFTDLGTHTKVKNPLTGRPESANMGTDTLSAQELKDYRVVSFRADDCGPFAGHAPTRPTTIWTTQGMTKRLELGSPACIPQLRLVLQPSMYWEDVALHFVYSFTDSHGKPDAGALRALAQDLLYLKSINPLPTNGSPLGPQLGLRDPHFQSEVLRFLRHYAQPENLVEIAVLSTNSFDGNNEWLFTSVNIQHGAEQDNLVLNPILAIKDSPLSMGFRSDQTDQVFERPAFGLASPEKTDLPTILKLMNPLESNNQAVDCLSCHSETRSLLYKSIHQPSEFSQLKYQPMALPNLQNITGLPEARFLPSDRDGVEGNFRQFGFFQDQPVVTFRTAMESALVADSLNQFLFGPGAAARADEPNRVLEKIQSLILSTTSDHRK